jgi:magnesium chelatase family protein
MNLCPCGRRGDPRKTCHCSPGQVARYVGRLSGPLLDRIDIHIEVPALRYDELRGPHAGETSDTIRSRIETARRVQAERFPGRGTPVNATMTPQEMETHCALDAECESLLRMAMTEFGLSARASTRILKVARTIADLDGTDRIGPQHLSEAVQYRTIDRKQAY